MKKIISKILVFTIATIFVFNIFAINCKAQETNTTNQSSTKNQILNTLQTGAKEAGYKQDTGANTLIDSIASVVNIVLGLLGIIFLILIIISGIQWMIAGGNDDVIKKAKGRIKNAIIGLAITLFSYAISSAIHYYLLTTIY